MAAMFSKIRCTLFSEARCDFFHMQRSISSIHQPIRTESQRSITPESVSWLHTERFPWSVVSCLFSQARIPARVPHSARFQVHWDFNSSRPGWFHFRNQAEAPVQLRFEWMSFFWGKNIINAEYSRELVQTGHRRWLFFSIFKFCSICFWKRQRKATETRQNWFYRCHYLCIWAVKQPQSCCDTTTFSSKAPI